MGRFWKAAGGGAAGRLVEEDGVGAAVIVVPEFLAASADEPATAELLAAGGEDTMPSPHLLVRVSSSADSSCYLCSLLRSSRRHKGSARPRRHAMMTSRHLNVGGMTLSFQIRLTSEKEAGAGGGGGRRGLLPPGHIPHVRVSFSPRVGCQRDNYASLFMDRRRKVHALRAKRSSAQERHQLTITD